MPGYRVRFLRTVSNDTGHEANVCQALLDVEAASEDQAIARAKEAICSRGVSPWSLSCFCPEVVPLGSVPIQISGRERAKLKHGA